MAAALMSGLSVLLAGCAAAAIVRAPADAVRRLGRGRGLQGPESSQSAAASWPSAGAQNRLTLLRPRPGAPPPRQRYPMAGVAGIVASLGWQLMAPDVGSLSWAVAPPVAIAVALLLGRLEGPAARSRRLRMMLDLPQVLELLAAAMQAGLPLRTAVAEVIAVCDGPLMEDLHGVLNAIDLGSPDAQAWRSLRDHPALGRVSIDLARSVDSGTMVVATLRRHARMARRDRRGALEARARTVGVKSVPPLMTCFVPAFLLICVVPIVVTAIRQAVG